MVGKTEEELTEASVPYEIGKARYKEIARGQIVGDVTGLLKLVFHSETRELLGVHIIGEGASELVHIGQAVLAFGGKIDYFIETAHALGQRLGPTLVQLPPGFTKDLAVLRDFLALLNKRMKTAFEFRNKSWLSDDTFATLEEAGCALCIAETDKLATPTVRTAPYAYMRLRKEDYADADLARWAEQIKRLASECTEVDVFLKHATGAPALVEKLTAMVGSV